MLFKGLKKMRLSGCGLLSAALVSFCVLLTLIFSPIADAQEKILSAAVLKNDTQIVPLANYTVIQKDPTNRISVDSITSSGGAILSGQLLKEQAIRLSDDGIPVWLSTKLTNESSNTNWVIDFGKRSEGRIGTINSVKAYELKLEVVDVDSVKKNSVSLSTIQSNTNYGVYNIHIEKGQQKIILFNIAPDAGQAVTIPFKLYTQSAYISYLKTQTAISTSYCLIFIAFAIFFLGYFALKRSYILFITAAYFVFTAIRWSVYDAAGATLEPGLADNLILILLLIHSLTSIYMTKIFCRIDATNYTEKHILFGLAWLNVAAVGLLYLLPISNISFYKTLLYGAPIITMATICLMSFAQAKNQQIRSYLYFYSWAFPLFGFIIAILSVNEILPNSGPYLYAFWYFIIPQGALLFFALRQELEGKTGKELDISGALHETLNLSRIKETKDSGDHSRLLKVIEQERQALADMRTKEAYRTEEMRRAKEEADEANRAKSAFLAVVSHEIRTPMTGVMGMVRLLLESNISKQQRDYVLTIQESSEAMLTLLNDILDFEKIQRGKIDLENISFDLQRLIQGVVTLMSGHAAQKKITLSARVDEDIPRYVKGDPTRLRQVLLNLMGNAIKFTEKGAVTLHVKNLNNPDDVLNKSRYSVYFGVQDSGIGISLEAQKNLFNPFAQASESITRKFGGTGLGLAISKGLIEKMGSAININSKEGEGSTFFFTLQLERGLSTSPDTQIKSRIAEEDIKPARSIHALVVDDNSITRKVVMSFLEQGNHTVTVCGTAEEGLKKIDEESFDLVLMDIELPGLRGNEAVKVLRESGAPVKQSLPVFAMTGNVAKEDMERYLADGMSGILPKPIDLDKLRSIIVEIARNNFVKEIKALGDAPNPVPKELMEELPRPQIKQDGVFNTVMLQSLKDTLGTVKLNELLGELIDKTEEILKAMEDASRTGDLAALAARAHELKGMAGNFGLTEMSTIAAQAERKATAKEMEELYSIIASLPDANIRAKTALKEWISR